MLVFLHRNLSRLLLYVKHIHQLLVLVHSYQKSSATKQTSLDVAVVTVAITAALRKSLLQRYRQFQTTRE